MMPKEKGRESLIGDLLLLARPLQDIANELAALDWDFNGKGVELRPEHLRSVLRRFLEGGLTAVQVETWANLIEAREDVFAHDATKPQVENVLYELANPLLTQQLGRERVNELLKALG